MKRHFKQTIMRLAFWLLHVVDACPSTDRIICNAYDGDFPREKTKPTTRGELDALWLKESPKYLKKYIGVPYNPSGDRWFMEMESRIFSETKHLFDGKLERVIVRVSGSDCLRVTPVWDIY